MLEEIKDKHGKILLSSIEMYTSAMPTQWRAVTNKGTKIYIRYRHDSFSMAIEREETPKFTYIYSLYHIRETQMGTGEMTTEELVILLRVLDFVIFDDRSIDYKEKVKKLRLEGDSKHEHADCFANALLTKINAE